MSVSRGPGEDGNRRSRVVELVKRLAACQSVEVVWWLPCDFASDTRWASSGLSKRWASVECGRKMWVGEVGEIHGGNAVPATGFLDRLRYVQGRAVTGQRYVS